MTHGPYQNTAIIHSFAKALPTRCVANVDLEALMDTSDEWITQRTGIKTRYWAEPPTTTSSLATTAAQESLRIAGLEAPDAIVAATLSPDFSFPGIGVQIQNTITNAPIPAFDVRNQCSGFLYGLEMASALVCQGCYRRVLLVGAEVHSTGMDISTRGRDIAVLFGDGAGSCLVEPRTNLALPSPAFEVMGTELHAEGAHVEELWCEHPGSAHFPTRLTPEMVAEGEIFPSMNGRAVFENAVRRMSEVSHSLLSKLAIKTSEISLLVAHQANIRINTMLGRQLGIGEDRVFHTIQKYGNTTAATIPIGMTDAVAEGRLHSGDIVLMTAFGSGFTWGAAVVRCV